MAMFILPKFFTLKWNISRTIWRIEVGDGSFFRIFHALSFEPNFFFWPEVPFNFRIPVFVYVLLNWDMCWETYVILFQFGYYVHAICILR